MATAWWFLAFAVVLIVGNLVAAKPKPNEMRLDALRFLARQVGLYPKIVARPDWLLDNTPQTRGVYDRPQSPATIAQYTLVDDAWRLPKACFLVEDGAWKARLLPRPPTPLDTKNRKKSPSFEQNGERPSAKTARFLATPPDFGELTPFVKAFSVQANAVALLVDDGQFAKTVAEEWDKAQTAAFWEKQKARLVAYAAQLGDA